MLATAEQSSSKAGKKRLRPFLWLLPALLLPLIWLAADMLHFVCTPASSEPTEKLVVVPTGASLPSVGELLQKQGLVRSARRFLWLVRLKGAARQMKAGEYQLSTGLRPGELVDKLSRGEVLLHKITFPEGYTMRQMAELLDDRGLASMEGFIATGHNLTLIRNLNIPASSLEGYLFPDTYRFARGLPVESIMRTIVARFNQHFGPAQKQRASQLGFTRHQVVILASVVERETAIAEERPLVAGVFFNRLKRKIRLQSDPTVIYGLRHFNGNLTKAHLQKDTPYNTYTRRGLPVGPICNPGAASIQAVLNPTPTSYLYFVARKDGTHHFSSSLTEHNAAVLRHQKRR